MLVKVLPGDLVQVPSGNGLKVYSVKNYGAIGDGSTDDTTAIQNAINAVATAGGGTVYFPNGVYIVGGALQDTSGANAQLTLPSVSAPGTQQYTVRFLGETPPSQIPWYLGGGNTPSSGVVIKSTLTSGNGALLGGYGPGGSYQNFTNITVVVENIDFRMVPNPTNSCLNFFYVNSAVLKNIVVDSGNWIGSTVTQPTTATSYGVKMPQNNNGGNNYVDQVQVVGFYTNYLDCEHCIVGQLELYSAIYAVEFQFAGFPSKFQTLLYHNCTNGLRWTGAHTVNISMLKVEHTDQAAWYATSKDILDSGNLGRGTITYTAILSNIGYVIGLSHTGGDNLMINCLNFGQLPYGSVLGNDLDNDASIYTNGSYLALNSKPGANSLYLNFRNSNSSSTVDLFNGNAVVTQPGNLSLAGLTASSFVETDASKVLVSKTKEQMKVDLATTTNDSATAGGIGELVSSLVAVGSPQSLSNGTAANVTSISLTAGDWDVEGNVNFTETTSTVTARSAGISSTSATLPTDGSEAYCGVQSTVTSETNSITLPRKRISIASTTTIYLVGKASFSAGTCGGFGGITARRVR